MLELDQYAKSLRLSSLLFFHSEVERGILGSVSIYLIDSAAGDGYFLSRFALANSALYNTCNARPPSKAFGLVVSKLRIGTCHRLEFERKPCAINIDETASRRSFCREIYILEERDN